MTTNPPVAAIAQLAAQTLMLDTSSITPSPTNPRKTFPEQSLQELAASMARDGQVQAILVRPISVDAMLAFNKAHVGDEGDRPQYEIVSGERRWRAATIAGIQVRAEIRELTDLQVVRIQIIENLHREEVHPLEEAEGYEYLLRHSAEQITIDQVADEVGKSKSYVYQRMKLAALCPEARKSFLEGKFDASTALLLARLPSPALQTKAIEDIEDMGDGDKTPSYRQIRAMLRDRYQLQLADAPFDIQDAKLLAGCGACTACPKRTGNQPMLFQDVENPDVCTDPDCFAAKRHAHNERVIAEARKKGLQVIEGDEAKSVMPYPGWINGYSNITEVVFGEEGEESAVTLADLMKQEGKKAPKAAVIVSPKDGTPVTVISDDAMRALVKKHEPKYLGGPASAPGKAGTQEEGDAERAAREEREAKWRAQEIDREYRNLLHTALVGKAEKTRTVADLILIIFALCDETSEELMAAAGGTMPGEDEPADAWEHALLAALRECSSDKLASLAVQLALGELGTRYSKGEIPTAALEFAAERRSINVAGMRDKAEKIVDKRRANGNDDDEDLE